MLQLVLCLAMCVTDRPLHCLGKCPALDNLLILRAQWPIYIYTDVPSEAYAALEQDQPMHKLCHAVVSTTSHHTLSPMLTSVLLCYMKGSALATMEDI